MRRKNESEEPRLPERQSLVTRVRGAVERDGVAKTVRRGLRQIAAPVIEAGSLIFFVRDLDAGVEELAPRTDGGYRVREAAPAEIDAIRHGSAPGRSLEALRQRFRRGHLCFVAVDDAGRVGHVRWVTSEPPWIPELQRCLVLAPGDVYFYDGFTRPGARRLGLDGLVRTAIFRTMRRRGFRRAVSYVRADNPAGLRAAGRWQRRKGSVRWIRSLRRRPLLLGASAVELLAFGSSGEGVGGDEEAVAERAQGWREWFQGWVEQPLDRRSTGFSALPDAYFESSADFIAGAVGIDGEEESVLDVGCSSGGISHRVVPRCRDLTGADTTLGLLRDAARSGDGGSAGARRFLGADGRRLPFPDGAFGRVYCTGMIHTLPSHEDGFRVVRELVRVCRPGGRILLGALPDRGRRWRARLEVWRRGTWRDRAGLVGSLLLPGPVKRLLRRITGVAPSHRLVALEYDLEALERHLRELDPGLRCREIPFPDDFWSRDFRTTRSNLLIEKPESD